MKGSHENACASLVVLEFPSLETVYEAYERVTMSFPYVSGFLAFREVGIPPNGGVFIQKKSRLELEIFECGW